MKWHGCVHIYINEWPSFFCIFKCYFFSRYVYFNSLFDFKLQLASYFLFIQELCVNCSFTQADLNSFLFLFRAFLYMMSVNPLTCLPFLACYLDRNNFRRPDRLEISPKWCNMIQNHRSSCSVITTQTKPYFQTVIYSLYWQSGSMSNPPLAPPMDMLWQAETNLFLKLSPFL